MAGVVESEPVVSIRTRAEFRPDGVLLRHVDREGAKFCQLSTRATLGHLVAELRKKGYRVCCPRQYGGRYPTWPRLRCMCARAPHSVGLLLTALTCRPPGMHEAELLG